MVVHWRKERGSGWAWRSVVNGFGAVLTGVVFVVVAYEKFFDGAWMVLIFIPILIAMMVFIRAPVRLVGPAARDAARAPRFRSRTATTGWSSRSRA